LQAESLLWVWRPCLASGCCRRAVSARVSHRLESLCHQLGWGESLRHRDIGMESLRV